MRSLVGAAFTLVLAAQAADAVTPPACANDLYAHTANGIPTPRDDGDSHGDINDVINLLKGFEPGSPDYLRTNADADRYFVKRDGLWNDLDGTVAFLGLSANNENILGIYTGKGQGVLRTPLLGPYTGYGLAGDGTPGKPFPASFLGLDASTPFGWYLEADYTQIFYSEEWRNHGEWDHLFSYAIGPVRTWVRYPDGDVAELVLGDAYVLAWEDMIWDGTSLGDEDYDDMLYLVGHVITSAEAIGIRPNGLSADGESGNAFSASPRTNLR